MKHAPLPINETARSQALQRYGILDTEPEEAFDNLARLAATICAAPMSLVSLIDSDRQWFKAKVGLSECETPRDLAVCAHTILDNQLFIVEDASKDRRFFDNPLVTGEFCLRFYAGVPLIDGDGHALGTLCVLDRQPRTLDDSQRSALETLAQAVMAQLDLRRQLAENTRQAEELAVARDLALEASHSKSQFLATMSHELRTPLNAIIGFSELLLDEIPGSINQEQREYVAHTMDAGQHLLDVLTTILDLAQIAAGQMEIRLTTFAIDDVLRSAIDRVSQRAEQKRLTIEVESAADERVHGDADKLLQVVVHLLDNAVKFSHEGKTVKVRARPSSASPNHLLIEVQDDGLGIAVDQQEKIFDEFHQVESGFERRHSGTGLGLALSRKLLQLMGGEIEVDSELGKGSRFTVSLPVA